jgi:sodium transport system permease protein
MNLPRAITVFRKEIRDVIRDRRTIMVMIVLPIVLYPILMIAMSQIMIIQSRKLEEKPGRVVVQGESNSAMVMEHLKRIPALELVEWADPFLALKNGDIQMIVDIPQDFDNILQIGQTAGLKIYYDRASDHSRTIRHKVMAELDSLKTSLAQERLLTRGVDPDIIHPIEVESVNIASPGRMGAYAFGGAIAMLLTLMALIGAFYPAIDLTAGEKERGTLETLLVSPVSRLEIVLGKFLTVITISVITAFMNLFSMALTIGYGIRLMSESVSIEFSVSPVILLLIFLLLLPVAVLFSSICLAVASFSRSFKEGQNLLTPIQMVAIMLGFVAIIPGVEMTPAIAVIPVANVVLLIKEILLGQAQLGLSLLVFASIAVAAWIGVRWAVNQFQREDILFLEGGELKWSSLLRRRAAIAAQPIPGMGGAWLVYLLSLILLFYVGQAAQIKDITRGLFITEVLLIAGPPLLLAKYLRYDRRRVFRLHIPRSSSVVWTILAAISTWAIVVELSAVQNEIFPYPQSFLDAFEEVFLEFHHKGLAYSLAMMAVLPALCEETLFRGFIMTGFQKRLGATRAVLLTALLFGLFHLSPYRYLPTTFLGILIGAVVVWTSSIWSGILVHFLVNGSSTMVAHLTHNTANQTLISLREGDHLPIWIVIVAMIVLIASVRFLYLGYRNAQNPLPERIGLPNTQ